MAIVVANREIQTEAFGGWAANLPCWRHSPQEGPIWWLISKIMMGGNEVTGYHFFHIGGLFLFFHFPFFVGVKWTLAYEIQVFSLFMIWSATQDFIWFACNSHYHVFGGFNSQEVAWHSWVGPIPIFYIVNIIIALGLACFGNLPKFNFQFVKELGVVIASYATAALALAAAIPKNWR
jgi:hypothetical protein